MWQVDGFATRIFTHANGTGLLTSVNPYPRCRVTIGFADGRQKSWLGNGNHFEQEMLGIEEELRGVGHS